MKISLLTDAPKHNLALMQLSAWHKAKGDEVVLNMPIFPADYTYASVLFEKNRKLFIADEYGGIGYARDGNGGFDTFFSRTVLSDEVRGCVPDYTLFNLGYSLGYTYRPCFRGCKFCKVWKINHPDTSHHSIWEFHNSIFNKICILNNNTFFDPNWKETFEEIWDANLTVVDENGYDLRLLDDEKAEALKKTRFDNKLHFAWDRIKDEHRIRQGLELLKKYKINNTHIYVLIGFDTTQEEDLHRCQILVDYGHDPYIMPYKRTRKLLDFQRFINTFMWRKYKTIKEAWEDYR